MGFLWVFQGVYIFSRFLKVFFIVVQRFFVGFLVFSRVFLGVLQGFLVFF